MRKGPGNAYEKWSISICDTGSLGTVNQVMVEIETLSD
jgi:hypothetical protein